MERDNRTTGQRDWKDGETVKRGDGEAENLRITLHALRITIYASRLASSEWRMVFGRAVFLRCRKIFSVYNSFRTQNHANCTLQRFWRLNKPHFVFYASKLRWS
jgi:hypothetical protein